MPDWLATLLLVTTRITAFMLIVPGLSQSMVPWRIRFLLIAMLTVPVLCVIPPASIDTTQLAWLFVHEAVVGVSLSLVPAAIVFGLQVAAQTIQGMTGLPQAGVATPSMGTDGSSLGRLMLISTLAVFFASSGHRVVFESALDSFKWLPPGSYHSFTSVNELLLDLLAASFKLGVRAMAPIGLALAISLMMIAALNRVLPQISYFAVGMSIQAATLFAALVLFGGSVAMFLDHSFLSSVDTTRFAWQALLTGAHP